MRSQERGTATRTCPPPPTLALLADQRANEGWFLASVAFARARGAEASVTDADDCDALGKTMESGLGLTLQTTQMADVAGLPRCRIDATVNAERDRAVTFTLMESPSAVWGVTCNYDSRDADAKSTCTTVLESWKHTPAS